jgi:hypothetical protein
MTQVQVLDVIGEALAASLSKASSKGGPGRCAGHGPSARERPGGAWRMWKIDEQGITNGGGALLPWPVGVVHRPKPR